MGVHIHLLVALVMVAHWELVGALHRVVRLREDHMRLRSGVCESAVLESFKRGLSSGGTDDILKRARELDAKKLTGGEEDKMSLIGLPCFSSLLEPAAGPEASTESALSEAGALIFRETLVQTNSLLLNPRDTNFLITEDLDSSSLASTLAVEAVAGARVTLALIPSAQKSVFPTAVSWTGLCGIRLPGGAGTLVGGQLEHLVRVRDLLVKSKSTLPLQVPLPDLKGVKLAWVEQMHVEPSVASAIAVAVEMFNRAGAECKQVKTAADLENGSFNAVITPASPSAALPAGHSTSTATTTTTTQPLTVTLDLLDNLSLTMPCGLVAGEDDGYDSGINEDKDREGLPINVCITTLSRAAKDEDATILAAQKYVSMTRWGSDVHRVGATRLEAAADIDDIREAFGIYFVKTLLRYMGKRQPVTRPAP